MPCNRSIRRWLAWAAVASVASTAGCRRDEITHSRVRKPSAATLARTVAPASPSAEVPPPEMPRNALKWSLPRGWTATAAGGIRYATLKAPVSGRVDVSVVVLPGPAGGELANVNRWRGQLGLPGIDEAALARSRQPIRSKAGIVSVYDFESDGQQKSRLLAGLLVVEGSTWFVKMVGDASAVAAARPDFLRLLQSLHAD